MNSQKEKQINLLMDYINQEREKSITILQSIQSCEQTLSVLSKRYEEYKSKIASLEELLDAAKAND